MNCRKQDRGARGRVRCPALAVLAAALFMSIAPSEAQQSSRFVMERVTVSAIGGTASSARFTTTAVVAQAPVAGAASHCNQGFITGVGFWSLTGNVTVPIRLRLAIDQSKPNGVSLQWSGADAGFRLFRSNSPLDVTDPANLLSETPSCGYEESEAPAPGVLFYRVLAVPEP